MYVSRIAMLCSRITSRISNYTAISASGEHKKMRPIYKLNLFKPYAHTLN